MAHVIDLGMLLLDNKSQSEGIAFGILLGHRSHLLLLLLPPGGARRAGRRRLGRGWSGCRRWRGPVGCWLLEQGLLSGLLPLRAGPGLRRGGWHWRRQLGRRLPALRPQLLWLKMRCRQPRPHIVVPAVVQEMTLWRISWRALRGSQGT